MDILPYEELLAEFRPADTRCGRVAKEVARWIEEKVGGVSVEHIGSTAVPDLPGKGVIDLLLLYREGSLERVRTAIDALGFQRQSTRDPFPETRPMRLGSVSFDGTKFRLHLHILAENAAEVAVLRGFRDQLIADPMLRARYAALKDQIIERGVTDTVAYCERKERFFDSWKNDQTDRASRTGAEHRPLAPQRGERAG
jgi:GrpB-like predicted nucleotidyltransferase (UPF0157 family)